MDELKKYLQTNQELLNCEEPAPMVWKNIQAELKPAQKNVPVVGMIRWAAAACVIALAGIGGWYLLKQPEATQTAITKIAATPIAAKKPVVKLTAPVPAALAANTEKTILPQQKNTTGKKVLASQVFATRNNQPENMAVFANLQTSFTQVINLQKARISTMPMYAESADYFKDFNIQINQMEREEKAIKKTISTQGLNDDLLNQLIDLYQHKLTVLKQLQLEMNKTNNRYKQNRGPVDTTRTYFISI